MPGKHAWLPVRHPPSSSCSAAILAAFFAAGAEWQIRRLEAGTTRASRLPHVIPSGVSRAFAFARSAGTRSRGISLRLRPLFDRPNHYEHRNFFAFAADHLRHLGHAARSLRRAARACRPILPTWNFSREGCARAPASSRNIRSLAGTPQINALKTYITTNLVQRLLVLDSLGNLYKETSPGMLSRWSPAPRSRISSSTPPRISAASTWLSATAPSARTCRASMTISFSIASARSARRRPGGGGFRHRGQHHAGRASMRRDFRHAPGILDRAFAARFLDLHRQQSERDEYSHRPVERRAAPARIHRRGRREFLSTSPPP